MKSLSLLLLFLALSLSAQSDESNKNSRFDPAQWLADLRQLELEMSDHYANLEFAVRERKINLPALRQQTEMLLRNAKNEHEAQRAVEKFIDCFGDGHFEIQWATRSEASRPSANPPVSSLCERLGYKNNRKPGLDFSGVTGFEPLSGENAESFPGGLLRLMDGRVIGLIRIGLFSEHAYPEICERAVKALQLSNSAECDEDCKNRLELETANMMTDALSKRAGELRAAGAKALLVDITHNGGGSDWTDAAVRELSRVSLRSARITFLKHPHWTQNLRQELDDVERDISKGSGDPIVLRDAEIKLKNAIEATRESCDTSTAWDTGKLRCSVLVQNMRFVSGLLEYAKPGSYGSLESKTILFQPLRYKYEENPERLPLLVLVDRDTWSSAEYFAALLQDNHAGTIVGESTGGAGCGYTNGGIPTTLKNSGAEVKMPDCVRLRADGSNEVNGIIPDIPVPWPRQASDYQRATRLVRVLESTNRGK